MVGRSGEMRHTLTLFQTPDHHVEIEYFTRFRDEVNGQVPKFQENVKKESLKKLLES